VNLEVCVCCSVLLFGTDAFCFYYFVFIILLDGVHNLSN
jgi:hypothetical protein